MQILDDVLIKVYRLPVKLTDGFAFGGGRPITFTNVDWFNAFVGMTRDDLEKFVRSKKYVMPGAKYLVLCDLPDMTFQLEG